MNGQKQGSIASGILWMFILTILLFWIPFVGPLLAGFVGGKKSGGLGPAITAVFLPIIVLGVVLFLLGSGLTGLPIVGLLAGGGSVIFVLAHIGPLLLGAIIGGLLA